MRDRTKIYPLGRPTNAILTAKNWNKYSAEAIIAVRKRRNFKFHQTIGQRHACDSCKRVCPLRIPHDIGPCNLYSRTPVFDIQIYVEMLQVISYV